MSRNRLRNAQATSSKIRSKASSAGRVQACIGNAFVAHSDPDGYRLLFSTLIARLKPRSISLRLQSDDRPGAINRHSQRSRFHLIAGLSYGTQGSPIASTSELEAPETSRWRSDANDDYHCLCRHVHDIGLCTGILGGIGDASCCLSKTRSPGRGHCQPNLARRKGA
jgi:hypothetical protein